MTLTKVTFHYSDGSSKFLVGSELDRWNQMNSQVASLAWTHGMNPDWGSIKWIPSPNEEEVNYKIFKQDNEQETEKA